MNKVVPRSKEKTILGLRKLTQPAIEGRKFEMVLVRTNSIPPVSHLGCPRKELISNAGAPTVITLLCPPRMAFWLPLIENPLELFLICSQ